MNVSGSGESVFEEHFTDHSLCMNFGQCNTYLHNSHLHTAALICRDLVPRKALFCRAKKMFKPAEQKELQKRKKEERSLYRTLVKKTSRAERYNIMHIFIEYFHTRPDYKSQLQLNRLTFFGSGGMQGYENNTYAHKRLIHLKSTISSYFLPFL